MSGNVFVKGESGNPNGSGRWPIVGGRRGALLILDKMLSKEVNKKLLLKAFQEKFNEDPISFFKSFVMPLLPRETEIAMEGTVGTTPITPDQLVLSMDRLTVPVVASVRMRLREGVIDETQ